MPEDYEAIAAPISRVLQTDVLGGCFDSDYLYINLIDAINGIMHGLTLLLMRR